MLSLQQVIYDRYQLEAVLSEKPGRKTFRALDLHTRSVVSIKFLLFNSGMTWEEVKLFEREAEVLRSLSHPGIPQYVDHFDLSLPNTQGFVIVQTWIPARSLKQHLESGRTFCETEIQQFAEQVLLILHDLHTNTPAIIHRDLKPSNILLGERSDNFVGQVYLIDFGSVQNVAETEDSTFTITGTYGYMPPEQFSGRTFPTSDLYSLGATLAQMLTGIDPAEIPHQDGGLEASASSCSQRFYNWLSQTLNPNPNQRFESAQQALEELYNPELRLPDLVVFQNNPEIRARLNRDLFHFIQYSDRNFQFLPTLIELVVVLIGTLGRLVNSASDVLLAFLLFICSIAIISLFLGSGGLTFAFCLLASIFILLFLVLAVSLCLLSKNLLARYVFRYFGSTELWARAELVHVKTRIFGIAVRKIIYDLELTKLQIRWKKSTISAFYPLFSASPTKTLRYVPASLILESSTGHTTKISRLNDLEAETLAKALSDLLQIPYRQE